MKKYLIKFLPAAVLCLWFAALPISGSADPEHALSNVLMIGEFSRERLDGWESKEFVGQTAYTFVRQEKGAVLQAVSSSSASGLIRKIRVDLDKTPFLNWSWKIEKTLNGTFDERTKPGDDYALRIYVVVSGGILVWNTKALNYVWAKHAGKGETWPNAFAPDNAVMKALRSSDDPDGKWVLEKRNVREDLKDVFHKDIRYIDAVVLMTDTDNTANQAVAYYGDIYFSKD